MEEYEINRYNATIQQLKSDNYILKQRLKETNKDLKILNNLYQKIKKENEELKSKNNQERFEFQEDKMEKEDKDRLIAQLERIENES